MSYYSRPGIINKFFRFLSQTACFLLQLALLSAFFAGATMLDGWVVDFETALDYVGGVGSAFSSQFYYSASRVAHGVMYIVFLVKMVITFIRSFRYLSVNKSGNGYAMNRSLGLVLYYFIAYLLLTHMLNPTQISWDGEDMLTTGAVLFILTRIIAWATQGGFGFGYIFKMSLRLVGGAVVMYLLLDTLWRSPLFAFGQFVTYIEYFEFIELVNILLQTVLWVILITTALRALCFWMASVGKNPHARWKTLRKTAIILLVANVFSSIVIDTYYSAEIDVLFGNAGAAVLIFILAFIGKFLFVYNPSYSSSSSSSSSSYSSSRSYRRSGIKDVFGSIFGGIGTVFGAIGKGIVAVFTFIGGIFVAIGKGIAGVFKWIWEKIDDLIYDIKYRRRNKKSKSTYNAYKSKSKPSTRASASTRYKKKENKFVAFFVRVKDAIVYGAVAVFDFVADKFSRLKKGKSTTSSTPKVHAPKKKAVKPAPVKPSYPLGPVFELNAGDIFGVEIIEEV